MNSKIKALRLKYRKAITHPGEVEDNDFVNLFSEMTDPQKVRYVLNSVLEFRNVFEYLGDTELINAAVDGVERWLDDPLVLKDESYVSGMRHLWMDALDRTREHEDAPVWREIYQLLAQLLGLFHHHINDNGEMNKRNLTYWTYNIAQRVNDLRFLETTDGGRKLRESRRQEYSDSLHKVSYEGDWQELLNHINMAKDATTPEEFGALLTDLMEERGVISQLGGMNVGGWGSTYEELFKNKDRIITTLTRLVQQHLD